VKTDAAVAARGDTDGKRDQFLGLFIQGALLGCGLRKLENPCMVAGMSARRIRRLAEMSAVIRR
jgi:hypothetical protein